MTFRGSDGMAIQGFWLFWRGAVESVSREEPHSLYRSQGGKPCMQRPLTGALSYYADPVCRQ